MQAQYCEQKTARYRKRFRIKKHQNATEIMNFSYETTQQILTYLIEFFGFLAFFVLPCEFIIKTHINEVRSWGKPENGYQEISKPEQKPLINRDKKEETPKEQSVDESEKPTTTKTKRRKKKELVTA